MTKRRPDPRRSRAESRRRRDFADPQASPVLTAAADPGAGRAALALWWTFVVLAVLRAGFAFDHSMWGWALNLQRFLAPLPGWGLWALASIALVPAVARRLTPPLARAGDAMRRHPAASTLAWMAAAGLLTWAMPDRVRFVGDFLLRQGSVEQQVATGRVFPQALPLDAQLHYRLPALLVARGWMDANSAARVLGALEAAGLAGFAVAFARALALGGAAAFAAAAIMLSGGYLAMFTGYGKAFSEMVLLTAAMGVFGLRVVRTGRGLLPLGIVAALAIALHRSALGFLPVLAFAWVVWARDHGRAEEGAASLRRPATWLALALPIATLLWLGARLLATLRGYDSVTHYATPEVRLHGGLLGAMFAGTRALDLVNLLVLLAPAALAVPPLMLVLRRLPGRREAAILGGLAVPFAVLPLLIHPANGLFRDWDDFAATGVAISLVAAWLVGETLQRAPRHAWVGAAVTVAVAVSAIQWLAHHTDLPRGLERVNAFVTEPPRRSDVERATTWDYLGTRHLALEHWTAAADAFGHSAETAPSPRILTMWAMAETERGDLARAQDVYRRVLGRDPRSLVAWQGLAAVSSRLGQFDESRRAAQRLLSLDPGNADALAILAYLDQKQGATDSLRR